MHIFDCLKKWRADNPKMIVYYAYFKYVEDTFRRNH